MVDDTALEDLYDYPPALAAPFVQVNFVASADGGAELSGKSVGLSSPGDRKILALGRDLADVVLVGWGTAHAEGYRGIKRRELRDRRRSDRGLSPVPPIAVVSGRCSVPPDSPLITDTLVPPIIITAESAAPERRRAVADAGAEVIVAGDAQVDPAAALAALGERGLNRVCCEGGPELFGALVAADLVDQLNLTVSPMLAGGGPSRIAVGTRPHLPSRLALESLLVEDGFVMLRYRRGH
ncbi:pyrimidine reductase family protein [Actinokineospora sp. NPDC004072]